MFKITQNVTPISKRSNIRNASKFLTSQVDAKSQLVKLLTQILGKNITKEHDKNNTDKDEEMVSNDT